MTDRLNLSFANSEHDLYLKVIAEPNASGLIKELLRTHYCRAAVPDAEANLEEEAQKYEELYLKHFGVLETEFGTPGGMRAICGGESGARAVLRNRAKLISTRHGMSAQLKVLAIFKERLPKFYRMYENE